MYEITRKLLFQIIAVLLIGATPVFSQFVAPVDFGIENSHLVVDYAAFRADDPDLIRVEFYYLIYNFGLEFREKDDKFLAHYELVISVDDDDDNRVETITRDKKVTVLEKERTTSRRDYRTSQVNLDLPQGKYKASFRLRDKNSGAVARQELEFKLDKLAGDHPKMSKIEFAQAFKMKGEKPGIFDKGNIVVVPSVTRNFGGDGGLRLAYYFELYPGENADSTKYVIETKINHYFRGMQYRDTLHVTLAGETERQLREISLEHFVPGEYEMEVLLLGRRNKKLDHLKENFEISWTQEGMLQNDWRGVINQLKYIAETGELDGWKNIESLDERRAVFNQFWLDKDPTVGTAANEAMQQFYHRVAIANHSFKMPRREGWKTDRGMIFIRFGHPDQIDDKPFDTDKYPYQIWHYYSDEGRYRRFTFVDEHHDGDYRLQYPYDGLDQRP